MISMGLNSIRFMHNAKSIFNKKRFISSRITDAVSKKADEVLLRSNTNYQSITRVSAALGGEIKQINLSQPLNQKDKDTIQSGLDDFLALVFRNQNLRGKQMVDSLKFLGSVAKEQHHVDQGLTLEGCPECFILRNDEKNPPLFDFWHSDKTSWKNPVIYTVLSCQETPDIGGDTLIANTRKAFDSMSEGMKKTFREMKGVYNEKNAFINNEKIVNYLQNKGFNSAGVYDHFKDQVHPIVWKNPRNGIESLYFSPPYFSCMEGFSKDESMYFQSLLMQSITKPEFIYRHSWKKGDLLIFDNTCTSHYAAADFYPQVRELHRIVITRK